MTTECKQFDDKLLDFLYEELELAEKQAFQAHLDGCARCQAELGAFGRVRTAAKELEMVEPPSAVTSKLIYQATQNAPRGGKVLPFLRRVVRHPAYAMAAGFLLVGGVATWQLATGTMLSKAPTPRLDAAKAVPVAAEPPAANREEDKPTETAAAAPLAQPTAAAPTTPVTATPAVAVEKTGFVAADKKAVESAGDRRAQLNDILQRSNSLSSLGTSSGAKGGGGLQSLRHGYGASAAAAPAPAKIAAATTSPKPAAHSAAMGKKSVAADDALLDEGAAPAKEIAGGPRERPLDPNENDQLAKDATNQVQSPFKNDAPASAPAAQGEAPTNNGSVRGGHASANNNGRYRGADFSSQKPSPPPPPAALPSTRTTLAPLQSQNNYSQNANTQNAPQGQAGFANNALNNKQQAYSKNEQNNSNSMTRQQAFRYAQSGNCSNAISLWNSAGVYSEKSLPNVQEHAYFLRCQVRLGHLELKSEYDSYLKRHPELQHTFAEESLESEEMKQRAYEAEPAPAPARKAAKAKAKAVDSNALDNQAY